MALRIIKSALKSRVVREALRQELGERWIDLGAELVEEINGEETTIIDRLLGIGAKLLGSLIKWIGNNFSFTRIWNGIVSTFLRIKAFNFNISDQEIDSLIASNIAASGAVIGGVLGTAVGWSTTIWLGAKASLVLPFIGGQFLRNLLMQNVLPEAISEVIGETKSGLSQLARLSIDSLALSAYKNGRAAVIKNIGILQQRLDSEIFNGIVQYLTPDPNQVVSINNGIDKVVDFFPAGFWRNLVDEFLESLQESLIQGGFVVASTFDMAWQAFLQGERNRLRDSRSVAVYPDTTNTSDKLVFHGPTEMLISDIQTTLNIHHAIDSKDVGEFVGEPLKDFYRKGTFRPRLTVEFRNVKEKPFITPDGKRASSWQYTIPEPKMGLSWNTVKQACRAYQWGRFRAIAKLDNNGQMVVFGASAAIAQEKLEELLELSNANILSLNVSEERVRNTNLRKDSQQAYPYKATYLFRRGSSNGLNGRTDLEGNEWVDEIQKMYLYPDTEPEKTIVFY